MYNVLNIMWVSSRLISGMVPENFRPRVSHTSSFLLIDESEGLKEEGENSSIIAGDLEVPIYGTNKCLQACCH